MPKLIINDESVDLHIGESIFSHADQTEKAIHDIATSCGRNGTCRECIIEIKSGSESLSPRTEKEEFLFYNSSDPSLGDFRLSCQAVIQNDSVDIVCETFKRTLQIVKKGVGVDVPLDPMTYQKDGKVYFGDEFIDTYRGHIYGISVDVGTTTVVFYLIDLESGETIYTSSFENPQKYGGSDILNRISYDTNPNKHGQLHDTIISFLNKEIRTLPVHRREIYEVVMAGNATMRDIFFGLNVETVGVSPYKSLTQLEMEEGKRTTTSLICNALDLHIQIHPKGKIYGLPLIGCHVGADTAAALMIIGIDKEEEPVMMIDIGTNTEVVLGNKDKIMAASCPAGPAFEGGKIKYGMPGIEGAIERISITNNHTDYHVIGDIEPKGMCGSGLIDLLAELLRTKKMDELGRLDEGINDYIVVPERHITFSRADISELAQAKSANVAGQKLIMRRYGVTLKQVKKYYLAGGFAWYINPDNAKQVGLIPPFPNEKIFKLGNASLEGTRVVLLNKQKRAEVETLVKKIQHIELEQETDFFDIFVEGAQFKPIV
jgi:uncharacterized 2Fe-2S/4Fe-4S cluster protein (DUF4445 family)